MTVLTWALLVLILFMIGYAWIEKGWSWISLIPLLLIIIWGAIARLFLIQPSETINIITGLYFLVYLLVLTAMCLKRNPLAKNKNRKKIARLEARIKQLEDDKVYKEKIGELKAKIEQMEKKGT